VPLFASTVIAPGQVAEMLVLSNQSDGRIARKRTYIFPVALWVSDYPFLRRMCLLMSVAAYDDAYSSDDLRTSRSTTAPHFQKKIAPIIGGTHAGSAAKTHCTIAQALLAIFVSCGVDYSAGNLYSAAEKT